MVGVLRLFLDERVFNGESFYTNKYCSTCRPSGAVYVHTVRCRIRDGTTGTG